MRKVFIAAVSVAAALFSASASAGAVIDFETAAMSNSPGSPVPVANQLSNQYLASLGVSFTSGAGFAAVVCHCGFTQSGQNIVGGTNALGNLDYSQPVTASFFNTANVTQRATTNFAKIWLDFIPLNSGTVTLQAFDGSGTLLGSTSTPDNGAVQFLSLNFAAMHSVKFFSDNRTVGFDDLEFGALTPISSGVVPEPASWALMITGFGLAGAALRNRRRALV